MAHVLVSTPIHRNTARDHLATHLREVAAATAEGEMHPDHIREVNAAIERQAEAIERGALHASKVDVLARAFALQDFAADQEEFIDCLDAVIDDIDFDAED